MKDDSKQPEGRDGVVSSLNMAIDGLNLAKEVSSITPVKTVFDSVKILLITIRDTVIKKRSYVELGLLCADICRALARGMDGKKMGDLNKSVCDAINQLTTTVAKIQKQVIKHSKRHPVSRFFHSRNDKKKIAAWKSDLRTVLNVFNTELVLNTHTIVSDVHQNVLKLREDADSQSRVVQNSVPGESPPPPRAFFGRDELIEEIVGLAMQFTPIALIGPGGIGKTSIALAVLHDDRIKQRFGKDRRFIRCDQFPASRAHFLRHLSKVIGADVENPEDLFPLRQFLSSKEMLIVLDCAESILDPRGTDAQEIHAVVEELSQFDNICLCITSRVSTVPPDCEILDVPTLSFDAALKTFYRLYNSNDRSNVVDGILEQLDFHPLSITLLATAAQQNKWDANRLTREWERQLTGMLHAQYHGNLGATIELSLASPMFRELGPDARELLGIVAFLPQGVNENNTDWLFPTIPDAPNILDRFCTLSLTYRSNGFITMLEPLRDHLHPKDPTSSLLLSTTKECYLTRLSVNIHPDVPGFEESRWIASEDLNVEHLLDVFTSIDANSKKIWDACSEFMNHLFWHKPRLITLGPKIEALPDDHPSKAQCLRDLSFLFPVGNFAEQKRLLTRSLKLWREQRDDRQVAQTLGYLTEANRQLGLHREGIEQAREASEIFERLGETVGQARRLIDLASALYDDDQLDAAEEAAGRAIDLLPEAGEQLKVCNGHRILGYIYNSKGETEKAIHHLGVSLGIASSLNLDDELFGVYCALAEVFSKDGRFNDAHAHVERAKSHAVNNAYLRARTSELQARLWKQQRRLEEAKSEALCALDMYERLGAADDVERIRWLLGQIDGDVQGNERRGDT